MIFRLLFLLLIILGSAANADIGFQDGELLSNSGAEPNSVVLASEPQNGMDEFVLAATEPPYAVGSSESSLIKGNNDECPHNPAQSSTRLRSKRESRICYPSTRNSPPSVQDSSQNPSKEDPQDNHETTKKGSQGNVQPNRNSGSAKEIDCTMIPSAPIPVCAVVSEDHIRLDLVFPMSGVSAGWWQLEYSRGATTPCYREVGEIFFCCAFVFSNVNNLRYPILRAQYPLTASNCLPMEDMNLSSEAPQP